MTGFTVASLSLAVAAHASMGAGLPDPWTLLMLTVLVAVACSTACTRRGGLEWSTGRIVGWVAGVQALAHLLLAMAGPTPGGMGASIVPSLWMTLAHGLAVVAVAIWLRRGEAALWRAARRVGWAALRWVQRVLAARPRPVAGVRVAVPWPPQRPTAGVRVRAGQVRGPPGR